jgi:hypothetical protein
MNESNAADYANIRLRATPRARPCWTNSTTRLTKRNAIPVSEWW